MTKNKKKITQKDLKLIKGERSDTLTLKTTKKAKKQDIIFSGLHTHCKSCDREYVVRRHNTLCDACLTIRGEL